MWFSISQRGLSAPTAKLGLRSSLLTFGRVVASYALLSLNRSLPLSVSSGIDYMGSARLQLPTINGRNDVISREIATFAK